MNNKKDNKQEKNSIIIFNGGDLSIDYHVQIENEFRKELKYVANNGGTAFIQVGNAFFTGALLKQAFSQEEINQKIKIFELYKTPTELNIIGLPSTFSIIRNFSENDHITDRKSPTKRISEYLGGIKGTNKGLYLNIPENCQFDQPNILILSEYNQDFRKERHLWPSCISSNKEELPPTFLRCSFPLLCEENPKNKLLHHLLGKSNADSNLVLFTTIDDLRRSNIYIKHGLSWESTALDLVAAFNSEKLVELRKAAFIIVIISRFGAFLYQNKAKSDNKYTLFYSKNAMEENNDMESKGSLHGLNTGLMIHVIYSFANSLIENNKGNFSFTAIKEGLFHGLEGISEAFTNGFTKEDKSKDNSLETLHFPGEILFSRVREKEGIIDGETENFASSVVPSDLTQEQKTTWNIISQQEQSIETICENIIRTGEVESQLGKIPYSSYGNHIVVGRREIEESREIKKLITSYTQKRNLKKPLSIAVFGEPGSGKSHSIEKIAASISEANEIILKFNLSQIRGKKPLIEAFHLIRDAAIEGKMVIVIWDEFDTLYENEDFGWVKHFLGPMQDGVFYEDSIEHPLGPSIFFFLSSKYVSFTKIKEKIQEIQSESSETASKKSNASIKLVDFVSRLQGHIEVPGINSIGDKDAISPEVILRRSIILRSLLERHCPTIFNIDNIASIDPGLIDAFLHINEYNHGTRSMEAIISMSHVDGKSMYNRSCLPAHSQLSLHVDEKNFWKLIDPSTDNEENQVLLA